jgi:hypothetical protein
LIMTQNLSHTVRKFNRYELKYVITLQQAEKFKTGLRVTFDTALTFQSHALHLHEQPADLPILSPNLAVMEIKVNERIPYWLKETRDVGFIFFTMAVGMAVGTRFYLLAAIATVVISLVILLMTRFNWYAREMSSQILRIQVVNGTPFNTLFDRVFLKYTSSSELISLDSVHSGTFPSFSYWSPLWPS